jgi:alanyl-tRNA synthetase
MKNKLGTGIVVVIGKGESTHPIIVSVSPNLTQKIKAGDVLRNITQVMGGKGGGRPDFAQGAGADFSKAKAALEAIK